MKKIILTLCTLLFSGCAVVLETATTMAIDDSRNNSSYNVYLIINTSGDSIFLKKYQIDGDTLYGHKSDFSEFKISKDEIIKIETNPKMMRFSDPEFEENRIRKNEKLKNHGKLALCLITGISIGAGVGYVNPMLESQNSQNRETNQFLSLLGGMMIGGVIGYIVYLVIKYD